MTDVWTETWTQQDFIPDPDAPLIEVRLVEATAPMTGTDRTNYLAGVVGHYVFSRIGMPIFGGLAMDAWLRTEQTAPTLISLGGMAFTGMVANYLNNAAESISQEYSS